MYNCIIYRSSSGYLREWRQSKTKVKFVSTFFFLACTLFSFANEDIEEELPPLEKKPNRVMRNIDFLHNEIRLRFKRTALQLDRFFIDEEFEDEIDNSYIRLRPKFEMEDGEDPDFSSSLRVQIDMPRTEKKWKIFIDSFMDEIDNQFFDELDILGGDDEPEDSNTALGVQYTFLSNARKHLKVSLGPKLRDQQIKPFFRVRSRFSFDVFDEWELRLTQSFFYDEVEWGERSKAELFRPIGKDSVIRFSSTALWTETSNGLEITNAVRYRQFLSDKSAYSVTAGMNIFTRPSSYVNNYFISFDYRQRFLRDWCYLSIQPGVNFKNEDDFKPKAFLRIGLEIVF